MWLLAGCVIGLGNQGEMRVASSGVDDDAVTVELSGRTWEVDLADVTVTEPPGVDGLVAAMGSGSILFHASGQADTSLSLVAAYGDGAGNQDLCSPVESLPTADFSENPVFVVDDAVVGMRVSQQDVDLRDTLLTATISSDGARWTDGTLAATLDARQVDAALDLDLCDLLDGLGGACVPCDDGSATCVDLVIDDISGATVDTPFDASADGSGC